MRCCHAAAVLSPPPGPGIRAAIRQNPETAQGFTMPPYRSRTTTHGRNMAGARGLWRATGLKNEDFGKPIIAVVNSFTQFVPGHVDPQNLGQPVARGIANAGGAAKQFSTIALDERLALGLARKLI